jgi:hypothetical protein
MSHLSQRGAAKNPVILVALVLSAGVLAMLGGLWRYRKTHHE